MSDIRNVKYPKLDAFSIGWKLEKNWDPASVQVSEDWTGRAKQGWGTAKNALNFVSQWLSLNNESEDQKIRYEQGPVLNITEEAAKCPRDGIETYIQPVAPFFHLGRATRRTWKHAYANWPHAIAWSVIYISALRMHSMTTLWTTAIFGMIANEQRRSRLAEARGEQIANSILGATNKDQEETDLKILLWSGVQKVYDNSENLRSKAGANIVLLATLAFVMGVTAQLKASVPAMSYGSLLTWTAAATTGFASAHYVSQKF